MSGVQEISAGPAYTGPFRLIQWIWGLGINSCSSSSITATQLKKLHEEICARFDLLVCFGGYQLRLVVYSFYSLKCRFQLEIRAYPQVQVHFQLEQCLFAGPVILCQPIIPHLFLVKWSSLGQVAKQCNWGLGMVTCCWINSFRYGTYQSYGTYVPIGTYIHVAC